MAWEVVDDDDAGPAMTYRLEVPGGWLYRVVFSREFDDLVTLVFVPFPPGYEKPHFA
jgi:hypothetical protein